MGLPCGWRRAPATRPRPKRQRQRRDPPDILLTTPEQLALLLATRRRAVSVRHARRVVLDELHSLVTSKRGDLLSLGLARLFALAPQLTTVGLSATVAEPDDLARFLVPQPPDGHGARRSRRRASRRAAASSPCSTPRSICPGPAIRRATRSAKSTQLIKRHKTTLVFVNTRSQAEFLFQELWRINDDNLAIALHHGSLDVAQRRKVEDAMARGKLRAVVCTSSLDLGVDWGDVDLVINVGAPKGASRLMQRIGRSNHRLDEPSRSACWCRPTASRCWNAAPPSMRSPRTRRTRRRCAPARSTCWRSTCSAAPCGEPFLADELYAEVRAAAPYAGLARADFDAAVDFVATGGYALKAYERFAKIRQGKDGRWRITHPRVAQRYRMNVGTIVEADMLKVRLVRSRGAAAPSMPRGGRAARRGRGIFHRDADAGRHLRLRRRNLEIRGAGRGRGLCLALDRRPIRKCRPMRAASSRSRPISPRACARSWPSREAWRALPDQVREWLEIQQWRSLLPQAGDLLVETFPRAAKYYLVCYPFEGRLAHQTLGMLLTRRLERARHAAARLRRQRICAGGLGPAAISACASRAASCRLAHLFDEDMLGDDLEAWLAESALMKRTFRNCAIIAGLIERRFPGEEKSRRQLTISTDLVYDVLRKHQPDHILLRAARADAATGLLDIKRLGEMLSRIKGRIVHKALDHVSPLAVPVMLEIGRETVYGEAADALLAEAADELVKEAMQ